MSHSEPIKATAVDVSAVPGTGPVATGVATRPMSLFDGARLARAQTVESEAAVAALVEEPSATVPQPSVVGAEPMTLEVIRARREKFLRDQQADRDRKRAEVDEYRELHRELKRAKKREQLPYWRPGMTVDELEAEGRRYRQREYRKRQREMAGSPERGARTTIPSLQLTPDEVNSHIVRWLECDTPQTRQLRKMWGKRTWRRRMLVAYLVYRENPCVSAGAFAAELNKEFDEYAARRRVRLGPESRRSAENLLKACRAVAAYVEPEREVGAAITEPH